MTLADIISAASLEAVEQFTRSPKLGAPPEPEASRRREIVELHRLFVAALCRRLREEASALERHMATKHLDFTPLDATNIMAGIE